MNDNTKDFQEYMNIINSLSDNEKAILSEYLNAHKEEFYSNPVDTFGKACVYAMERLVSDFISTRESLIPDTDGDYAKSIYNQAQQERGKAFVESMSQPIRDYRESLQASRDEKYNNMIEEYEDIERKKLISDLKKDISQLDYATISNLISNLYAGIEKEETQKLYESGGAYNWAWFIDGIKPYIDMSKYSTLGKKDFVEAITQVYNNYNEYNKSGKTM